MYKFTMSILNEIVGKIYEEPINNFKKIPKSFLNFFGNYLGFIWQNIFKKIARKTIKIC